MENSSSPLPPPSSFSRSGLSRTSGNSRAPLWCLWAAEFAGSYAEWNITVALFELPTNPPPGYTLTRDYLSLSIGLLRCEPRRRSSRFSKKFVSPYFCLPLFVCFFLFLWKVERRREATIYESFLNIISEHEKNFRIYPFKYASESSKNN